MTHPLISAADLTSLLLRPSDADVLVIDTRFNLADTAAGEAAYEAGHIPGALYAHLDRDLSAPKTGHNGRHPLPSHDKLIELVQGWGITPDTHVVIYDASGGMFAARLWWMLRWLGATQVRVLDGGWPAWLAQGGSTDQAPASPRTPSQWSPTQQNNWLVSTDEVLAHLGQPAAMQLLDARAPDRFRGENETLDPVGGHIPGAQNRFFQLNLQADGRFQPAETLRAAFGEWLNTPQGPRPVETLVHSCGSGVTACHNLLAMEVAGLPGSRLYAGSWSTWCADPTRPVATGA